MAILAQRKLRQVGLHKVLKPMVHISFKVTLQKHRDRERDRCTTIFAVSPSPCPTEQLWGSPLVLTLSQITEKFEQ